MKIYKHTGPGHYIGSCIIIVSDSREKAEIIIKSQLNNCGLSDEELKIEEYPIIDGKIIYINNGDY
jgi:hypothetical protein